MADTPALKTTDGALAASKKRRKGPARLVLLFVVLTGVGFGAYKGHHWWVDGRFIETTDDAYIAADITVVLSKVSGYVAEIAGDDNRLVREGEVLIRIDDGDHRLAVQAARDGRAAAQATVDRIEEQIKASEASVLQAEAALRAAGAAEEEAKLTYSRYDRLTATKVVSQASMDSARTALDGTRAELDKARAAIEIAKANVAVLQSQKKEASQAVRAAETAVKKAERDLEFTVVRAPIDGVLGNRAAQVGSFLQAGSRIAAIVPMRSAYIDANFKETQLDHIEPGAKVAFSVDAYPDETFHGEVESISPATGSVFSLLPSSNATGNFTKVVQRVPVRIRVDAIEAEQFSMRAGMSVVVNVDTRTGPDQGNRTVVLNQ